MVLGIGSESNMDIKVTDERVLALPLFSCTLIKSCKSPSSFKCLSHCENDVYIGCESSLHVKPHGG